MWLSFVASVDKLAEELRDFEWETFVDAADIRRDSEANHLIFQDVKTAWELVHPISDYVAAAILKLEGSAG